MPTGPILFPSGEDANPLHKRLPAEVVTRKPRAQPRVVEEKVVEDVRVDLKAAVILKPDARPKWLAKACKQAEENRASTTELYNIVTSRKFVSGLKQKIGRQLRDIVMENLELFSDKQRRYLKSEEWILNGLFVERAAEDGDLDLDGKDGLDDDLRASEQDSMRADKRDIDRRDTDASPPARKELDRKEPEKRASDKREARREDASEKAARALRRPERVEEQTEQWVTVAAGRAQEDRVSREQVIAEERAKRKAKEREERERWMQAHFEASQKQEQLQQEEAKKRQQEDAVDSSLMLLDEMMGGPPAAATTQRESERSRRGRGGLSRSRSVRVRSRSRRKRSRDGGRRRRRDGSPPKVDFADALRRRMEQREANDTSRAPVVDPNHAARWAQYDRRD